jgi:hypothetical protein
MTSRQTRTAAGIALAATLLVVATAHAQPTVCRHQEFGDATHDRLDGSGTAAARRPSPTSAIPRRRRATTSASTPANALVSRTTAPAAGICRGGRPCWRGTSTGWTYSQPAPGGRGLQKVTLRSGADGKSKLQAKGKGGLLALPTLPLVGTPVRAQMVNSDGECWGATYSNPARNDSDRFKAKSD